MRGLRPLRGILVSRQSPTRLRCVGHSTSELIGSPVARLTPKEREWSNWRSIRKKVGSRSKAGIVEHDAGGLVYSRSCPDSGPALAGARYGGHGPIRDKGQTRYGAGDPVPTHPE